MGDEPDADRRLHAQIRAVGAPARGRRAGPAGRRSVEIGDLAPLRRAVCGAHEAMAGDPADHLDLMAIQIDGVHMADDLLLVAAIGIDATGKRSLGVVEGATENAATARALIANLIDRGLDPAVPRLFIIDELKALSTAIRRAFGALESVLATLLPRYRKSHWRPSSVTAPNIRLRGPIRSAPTVKADSLRLPPIVGGKAAGWDLIALADLRQIRAPIRTNPR